MKKLKSTAKLQDFALFKNLSATSLSLLDCGLQYSHCVKATTLLCKGQRVSGAYVVLAGRLRVFTVSPEGIEATLYFIVPGETCVLALNCIFNDLLYPAWVEAESATKVAVIPGSLYRKLFESETSIRNITVQAFSTIVFRLMAELEQIHCYRLEQRLASFLLLHTTADRVVNMTQQAIASHLGSSREVIARLLRQFVANKLIQTKRNRIVIRNPANMAAMIKKPRGRQPSSG